MVVEKEWEMKDKPMMHALYIATMISHKNVHFGLKRYQTVDVIR